MEFMFTFGLVSLVIIGCAVYVGYWAPW